MGGGVGWIEMVYDTFLEGVHSDGDERDLLPSSSKIVEHTLNDVVVGWIILT